MPQIHPEIGDQVLVTHVMVEPGTYTNLLAKIVNKQNGGHEIEIEAIPKLRSTVNLREYTFKTETNRWERSQDAQHKS